MATVKLNTQHDYVTLKVKFANDSDINLTVSRRGEKVTAKGLDHAEMREALMAFHNLMKKTNTTGQTIGSVMNSISEFAATCNNVAELTAVMKEM